MTTTQTAAPTPIIREDRVHYVNDGELILTDQRRGDRFNLSTGEVVAARMINGNRYDTSRATIILGSGEFHSYGCYSLRRLYRTHQGKFFLLQMGWATDVGFIGIQSISVVEQEQVLTLAKTLLHGRDVSAFLLEWYCSGLLPRDDAFAQALAESVLSADECEMVLAAFGARYAPQPEALADA
ncbi:MAG: hypothetical protein ABI375_00445 [Rudaea sp.]